MADIVVVTSTKQDEGEFRTAPINDSIWDYSGMMDLHPVCNHTGPIADAYNRYLTPTYADDYLVFMHADASIKAPRFREELEDAFAEYDVIGIAGSTHESMGDCGWAFTLKDGQMAWKDPIYLSGAVFHTDRRQYGPSTFGPAPQPCEQLDGVFLAMNAKKVVEAGIRFDPQLAYDFYDLDFCKQARNAGLRLGTWPFKVTHASAGRFNSDEWQHAFKVYKTKWLYGN